MLDVLIKNTTIIDGSMEGKEYRADLGINSGRISAIGALSERASRTIDGTGLVTSPGFIDVQNHSDSYGALLSSPSLESLLYQGITSAIVGHCGSSLAPLLSGSLASIQKWSTIEGVNVNWRSVAEFLETVGRSGLGTNLGTFVGHATIRREFASDASRALSEREIQQVTRLLERSFREGGWGLSIGLEYAHEREVAEEELIHFLKTTHKEKRLCSLHLRDEGPDFFSALSEVLFLLRSTDVRTKISHIKIENETDPARGEHALETITSARAQGHALYLDIYPYTVSAGVLYLFLPSWATEGGRDALLSKLRNDTLRTEIAAEMRDHGLPYERITIASGLERTLIGKSIAELARNQGRDPEDIIMDLLIATNDQIIVFFENIDEAVMETFLKDPYTMVATDGSGHLQTDQKRGALVHPRSFGSTARLLGRYVRERKTLSLPEAIYKLTGLPAAYLGLVNRGAIRIGNAADLVLFDRDRIADMATFKNPFEYPKGIEHVLVNGRVAISNGRYTGETAGTILRP